MQIINNLFTYGTPMIETQLSLLFAKIIAE